MSNLFITGTAHFPAITRPDTKFDELGQYKASLIVSEADAAPHIAAIQANAKAHTGKALPLTGNPLFKPMVDDDGNPTGDILFTINVKNKMTKKGKLWDRKPLVIDAKMHPMADDITIWGGSTLKVEVEPYNWEFSGKKGTTNQPITVQVLDLKTGGKQNDLSGFGEEDGYVTDDAPSSGFSNEDTSGNDTSNSDY